MTWEGVIDNRGLIRAVRLSDRNRRVVRWDGLSGPTTDWGQANARMIVAAPTMLEVLEEVEECSRYWSEYDVPLGLHDRIKAAIAKARGENV